MTKFINYTNLYVASLFFQREAIVMRQRGSHISHSAGLLTSCFGGSCRVDLNTASKGKYAQVLGEVGNYAWLQKMLGVLEEIAGSHGVTIADVATRWVMDKPAVGAVIIGAPFLTCFT